MQPVRQCYRFMESIWLLYNAGPGLFWTNLRTVLEILELGPARYTTWFGPVGQFSSGAHFLLPFSSVVWVGLVSHQKSKIRVQNSERTEEAVSGGLALQQPAASGRASRAQVQVFFWTAYHNFLTEAWWMNQEKNGPVSSFWIPCGGRWVDAAAELGAATVAIKLDGTWDIWRPEVVENRRPSHDSDHLLLLIIALCYHNVPCMLNHDHLK